jgi:hypothetical protein
MRLLEDFTPYDRSRLWALTPAYYARAGAAAWTSGKVPYLGTSNYPMALQHARVLVGLVRDLEEGAALSPTDPVAVLEVGSGLGVFAENLLVALAQDCGDEGRAVLQRLRYYFSDVSPKSIDEALGREPLAAEVRSGRIVPAILNLSAPDRLQRFDGSAIAGPFVAIFANYVCCALAPTIIQKREEALFERVVSVALRPAGASDERSAEQLWSDLLSDAARSDLTEHLSLMADWRERTLPEIFGDSLHEKVFTALTRSMPEATVPYPRVFIDFVRCMTSRTLKGGVVFVSDFGESSARSLAGLAERLPNLYGNTYNQPVNFGIFDAFCATAGMGLVRTRGPWAVVQRAALVYGDQPTPRMRAAFQRAHVGNDRGERYLDLNTAAKALLKAGDNRTAARVLRMLLKLDPRSSELHFRLAEACFDSKWYSLAIRYLRRGRLLDVENKFDFDFKLGCAYFALARLRSARVAFKRALTIRKHPTTYANLAVVYEKLADVRRARVCYARSLALAPTGPGADKIRVNLTKLEAEASPA